MIKRYVKILWGDIVHGSLERWPFVKALLILTLTLLLFVMAIVIAIGGAEHIVGGNLRAAQAHITDTLGMPFVIIISIFIGSVLFAKANIAAKRIRNIGFSGWYGVLGIILMNIVIQTTLGSDFAHLVTSIIFLCLLFTPKNVTSNRKKN